jgi:hypothetical protein
MIVGVTIALGALGINGTHNISRSEESVIQRTEAVKA